MKRIWERLENILLRETENLTNLRETEAEGRSLDLGEKMEIEGEKDVRVSMAIS